MLIPIKEMKLIAADSSIEKACIEENKVITIRYVYCIKIGKPGYA